MPYETNKGLPDGVKDNLPLHGQDIYRKAYNSAWDHYDDPEDRRGNTGREETAHRVAWSAVKNEYEKNDDGNWVKK